jgi:peptide/nickel transport system substrate-binding protein
VIGSGPYRYKADERVVGFRTVYERFAAYRAREGGVVEGTAGPKIAHFDRVEWTVEPDPSTSAAALQTGERDWWQMIVLDLLPVLRGHNTIRIAPATQLGNLHLMRMNHLQPPFNNPDLRRALLGAVKQEDYLIAMAGTDPTYWRAGVGCFPPESPMASTAGLEALTGPRDLDRVRRDIAAAGYEGERVALMVPTDYSDDKRKSDVGADMMKKVGLNVDYQAMDLATFLQRVYKKEPVEQGGWSCYFSDNIGVEALSPAVYGYLRGDGINGWGWPKSPRLEELRDAWFDAADLATRQRIAAEMQVQALRDVVLIPLGQTFPQNAYRADLTGVVQTFPPVFWNVRRLG